MDSDDICDPARIPAQVMIRYVIILMLHLKVEFLEANQRISVVGTAVSIVGPLFSSSLSSTAAENSAEASTPVSAFAPRIIQNPTHPLAVFWSMHFYCALAHPSVMFRRKLTALTTPEKHTSPPSKSVSLDSSHFYSQEYLHCEDLALWLKLLRHNQNVSSEQDANMQKQQELVLMANLEMVGLKLRKHGGT